MHRLRLSVYEKNKSEMPKKEPEVSCKLSRYSLQVLFFALKIKEVENLRFEVTFKVLWEEYKTTWANLLIKSSILV